MLGFVRMCGTVGICSGAFSPSVEAASLSSSSSSLSSSSLSSSSEEEEEEEASSNESVSVAVAVVDAPSCCADLVGAFESGALGSGVLRNVRVWFEDEDALESSRLLAVEGDIVWRWRGVGRADMRSI